MKTTIICVLVLCAAACNNRSASQHQNTNPVLITNAGNNILTRIQPPEGYTRRATDGYGEYLRQLPLLPCHTPVRLYNGRLKSRQDVHAAVIDIQTGNKDLQQCADAVMRLRAEYLYQAGMADNIHFNFTNGFRADYSKWAAGYRITVKGNEVRWEKSAEPATDYPCFRKYLDIVFTYAGTLSLSKELQPVPIRDIQPGDVLIQGGSPGHAVIVADVAENEQGNKVFLLAQSYMPAQQIHVLKNFNNGEISPWYKLSESGDYVSTPEWDFSAKDLKRFE